MATLRLLFGLLLGVLLIGGTAMAQLSGTYTIGDGVPADSFTSFTAAVAALTTRGVGGPVTFNVEERTYNELVAIGQITGASATNTITFRDAGTLDTPPLISANAAPAVNLNGADYITFDGIDIRLTVTGKVVQITGNADYNWIKNCLLTGALQTGTTNYGVHITGGGNDYNVIDNVTVNGTVYYPVYLAGVSTTRDLGNEVRNCTLIGGKQGVYLYYQNGAVVRNCDIQPGYAGAMVEIMGIYFAAQTAGELSTAYANKIHNIRGAMIAMGIYAAPGTGGLFKAYNNFVYDYQVTGAGVLYGIYAGSGAQEFYFNSVYIGDVGTSGNAYGFYQNLSATTVHLKNNVIRVDQPTTTCWAIYRNQGTLTSDYNAVYGTGTGYNMGRDGTTNYANLALWQGGLSRDLNSVEGNPGFVSTTDLHIQTHYSLLNGVGLDTAAIATDFDGGGRGSPPDIGADEYVFTPMAHDYGMNKWVGWLYTYVSNVPVVIRAEVKNYGTSAETDVPVVLFYNGVPKDTVLKSLTSGEKDTVELDWTPPVPAGDQEISTLVVKAFCPSDTFAPNDSIRAKVSVVRPPLSGVYDLGGGLNHYATFTAAVTALTLRGVDGPVTFNVYANIYSGSVAIGPITGASADNTITFRDEVPGGTQPLISANVTPAVNLNGADYVTFDGIDITLTVTGKVVQITGDADYNVIKNCLLTGALQTGTSNYGLHITGGGNDYNVIENVRVDRSVYYPVYLAGVSATRDQGNDVRNCTLIGGKYGVYLARQNGAVVRDCDIQPGWDDAATEIAGIYLYLQAAGEPTTAYGNEIHNIRGANITNGIRSAPDTDGLFKAYNNFVYDFVMTGSSALYGLRLVTGTSEFYFNSVRIGDVGTTGYAYGFYQAGTSTAVLKNNIFQIEEPTSFCWAINRNAGTLTSNYNCVYGTGIGYSMGGDGTDYATLALWQVGTARDLNSVEGNPGLISATNLHIDSLFYLVDSAGTPIAGITDDIDGDLRGTPPDMGADEYRAVYPPEEVDSLTIFPDAATSDAILSWPAAAGANSYRVYRGTTYGFVIDETTRIGQTAVNSYTDVDVLLTAGAKYYVVVASTDVIARLR